MLGATFPAAVTFGEPEKFTWSVWTEQQAKLFLHNELRLWHKLCILAGIHQLDSELPLRSA